MYTYSMLHVRSVCTKRNNINEERPTAEAMTGLCGCTILTLRQNEQMKEQRFLSAPSVTAVSACASAPPHPWRGACSPSLHLGESVRV